MLTECANLPNVMAMSWCTYNFTSPGNGYPLPLSTPPPPALALVLTSATLAGGRCGGGGGGGGGDFQKLWFGRNDETRQFPVRRFRITGFPFGSTMFRWQ